jgi:magnesium chelatase family protein
MLNPKLLDEMSARVSSLLAATPAGDIEKNLRAALAGAFAKLDLVTREEFDVQREVLARTRAKLEALEARARNWKPAAGNPRPTRPRFLSKPPMSLAVLRSRALAGLAAPEVTVEVHLAAGLPSFTLVGLPDTEVKEARDRVRAAIQNCGFDFPQRRITVNLAPADLPKESGRFDLPIALGILIASGQIKAPELDAHEFAGELALSGDLRAVRGTLAMCAAIRHEAGPQNGTPGTTRTRLRPAAGKRTGSRADRRHEILPARNLLQVCAHLAGREPLAPFAVPPAPTLPIYPDLADVKGQAQAKRALEVAAAGGHSLLMSGPPGAGKSMLAQRLPGLLPPMTHAEALESAAVHSLAGTFRLAHWNQRPFRAPHHSASSAALVGGGGTPRPGEISLAHNGTLFLDELPEFQRGVLEALREPLETGHIHIARAARRAEFPARFQLVAAMNPCPCGWLGHPPASAAARRTRSRAIAASSPARCSTASI